MRVSDAARVTKLILLIDAENLPSKFATVVVAKAATLGSIAEGRVYGHFGSAKMNTWAKVADELGLTKVDVTRTTRAKNAADFKLIIEAVDMMHTRALDGFCLASSDGDFSALCERIRAVALNVYGFGEKKAPESYRKTCTAFFDCATLAAESKAVARPPAAPRKPAPAPAPTPKPDANAPKRPAPPGRRQKSPATAIVDAIGKARRDDQGWALLNEVGTRVRQANPDFEKDHGRGLQRMINAIPELETRKDGNQIYVRRRPA